MAALTSYIESDDTLLGLSFMLFGRAIERLSVPLSFPLTLPVFGRRKKSARSARIVAFTACRYEGVTRYIETGDSPQFFLCCLLFVLNSRTQEAATSEEIELHRRDGFNRLFRYLNGIMLSTVELCFSLFLLHY